jgi:hypothetical protein
MVAYGYMKSDHNQPAPSNDFWEQFYSVEFSIRNIKFLYQFKIWKIPENPAFVLVKENSDILNWIKTGHTLDMKYYSSNQIGSTQEMPTKIVDIERHLEGRFKGHYVVTLGALEN